MIKSFILLIRDTRKNKLYGNQDSTGETSGCSCSCPLTGDLTSSTRVYGCVVDGVVLVLDSTSAWRYTEM